MTKLNIWFTPAKIVYRTNEVSAILTKFEGIFTELQTYLKKDQKSEIELNKVNNDAEGLPV